MEYFTEKHINPFTDYGFKKLFREELNKDLLLDFLNELLKEKQGEIVNLTYLKNKHLSSSENDIKAIFDLYCKNEKGKNLLLNYKNQSKISLKTERFIIRPFPIVNR